MPRKTVRIMKIFNIYKYKVEKNLPADGNYIPGIIFYGKKMRKTTNVKLFHVHTL